jgi:hypothetical protein
VTAFDYLTRAQGFIYAASDVIDARQNRSLFRAPILHLLAHGAELLLKGVHIWHGAKPDMLRQKFGHDIWACWDALPEAASSFCHVVEREARDTWARADNMGMIPEDCEFTDGWDHFTAILSELSDLHTSKTDFALRYPAPDQKGMVPLHLRDTLGPTASWAVQEVKRMSNRGLL